MTQGELGFCKVTTVAVTMMCLGLGGHAWAGGPGAGETSADAALCAAAARATAQHCKVDQKEAKAACKQQAKVDKASCVKNKKGCVAKAKAAKRDSGASAIGVKCSVKNRACGTKVKADTKRCELKTKGDALRCDLQKQGTEAVCRAAFDLPETDFGARCQAGCDAKGAASTQVCATFKSHELKVCELTQKLARKDCKMGKAMCVEENRVAKRMKKAGTAGSDKDCSKRVKSCTRSAKEALETCKQAVADKTCEPDGVIPCTINCVEAALAMPPPEPPKSVEDVAVKFGKSGLPYPAFCTRDAIEIYTELLTRLFTLVVRHHEDVEAAVKAINTHQSAHKADVVCVQTAVMLWQTMSEAKQEALRIELIEISGMVRSLATSAPALVKDARIQKALSFK